MPDMNAILGRKPAPGGLSKWRNPRVLAAVVAILVLCATFWFAVHYIEHHAKTNPLIIMCFPVLGATSLALLLPLIFFLSFEDEFKRINPLNPAHYAFLVRKTYQAMASNQWKVSSKDV